MLENERIRLIQRRQSRQRLYAVQRPANRLQYVNLIVSSIISMMNKVEYIATVLR